MTSTGIFLIAIGAIAVVALTFILYHQNHGVSVGAILREDDIDRWTLVLNLRNRDRSDVTVDAVTVTVNGYYSGMTSRDYVTSPRFDGVDFPHRLPGSSSEMWTAPDTGIMSTAYALMDPKYICSCRGRGAYLLFNRRTSMVRGIKIELLVVDGAFSTEGNGSTERSVAASARQGHNRQGLRALKARRSGAGLCQSAAFCRRWASPRWCS